MGTDMLESMGHEPRLGNNMTISLELDDLADANQMSPRVPHLSARHALMRGAP